MDAIDLIVPKRPAMPIQSRLLFNSTRYCASLTRAGIIVQNHSTGTGTVMPTTHKQYSDWLTAWDDIVDDDEGNALCKALLR